MLLRFLAPVASLLALLLMAYGQYGIRRDPANTAISVLFLLAAAAAALLFGRGGDPGPAEADPVITPRHHSSRQAILAVVAGVLLIAVGSLLLSRDWRQWLGTGWAFLIGGVALLSLGLRGFDSAGTGGPRWSRGEWLALAVILAIATFLRFYRYAEFPDPFSTHAIEEQQTGFGGYQILYGGARPWEFLVDHYMAALAIYFSDAPTFLTFRIPFTIFSALTIVPVHLFLRQLVRKPAALAATFLFAVSSWNVIYSRCAHNIFLTNFFVVSVLALLVYFARTRRLGPQPWLGLLCGYTLYTYAGYRGTTLFAVLFLAMIFASDAWRAIRASDGAARSAGKRLLMRDLVGSAVALLVVIAVATPLYVLVSGDRGRPTYYFEAAGRSLANKEYYSSDWNAFVRQRLERVRNASRIFMHKGDDSLTFNAPDEPMVDPVSSVFFVGGLFVAAFFPRRRFNGFWVFMFVALMFGATVFVQNLDVRRLQGITVFVALFAALFLDRLWLWAQRLPAVLVRTAVPAAALALGAATLWWNYDVHFHKMARNPKVLQAFKNQYTTLIRYGRERGKDREILLMSLLRRYFDKGYYYRSHYAWLIDNVMQGRDLGDLSEVLPPKQLPSTQKRLTVIIQKPYESESVARLLTAVYPGTQCGNFLEPDNPYIAFAACDLPEHPAAKPLAMRLEARYWMGAVGSGEPFAARPEPFIAFAMLPPQCYEEGRGICSAEWVGTLEIPTDGQYQFFTETRGRSTIEVSIDGQPLRPGLIRLSAGSHSVRATASMPREFESGVSLRWGTGGEKDLVPFYRVED